MKQKIPIHSTSKLTWQSQFGLLYLIGVFCFSMLSFNRGLLDYTLLPRYTSGSLLFLLTALFLCFKSITKSVDILWPRMDWPTGLLFFYFVWSTISISWATSFSEAIFESQKVMLGFVAFYMCRWFQLNDANFISHLFKLLVIVSVGVLILACWQISQLNSAVTNAHYAVKGISGHKNLFTIVLFLLSGFLSLGYFSLSKKWSNVSLFLSIVILLLIIYLRTRSVYLGVLSVAAIFLFRKVRSMLTPRLASILSKVTLVLILLGLIGFIYAWQSNQLFTLQEISKIDQYWKSDTGYERLVLWEKTACVVRQSPYWGVGAGNWQIAYPNCNVQGLYSVELDFKTFQRPHNDWFWVWAETGIIGLLCYLGFFLAILQAGLHKFKKETFLPNQLGRLTCLSFIIGFMVIACFSFPKERIEILLLVFTLTGLAYPVNVKQNAFSTYFAKLILALIILSTSLSLYVGKKRMIGENAMKKVLILKKQQKWKELIEASDLAFSKWYTVDPTTIPIHWYRGTANFVLGRPKVALQDFLKAKKYTPYNQNVQNELGTCYETMGRKEDARAYYKEAIRISPMFDDPRVNIAVSYYKTEQYQEALDWIDTIRDKDLKEKYRKIILDKKRQLKDKTIESSK